MREAELRDLNDPKMAFIPGRSVFAFWQKVDRRGIDECWNWTGQLDQNGYGRMKWNAPDGSSQLIICSRFSFLLHNGWISVGLVIRHSCDNPACVNPKHLIAGTQTENNQDRTDRNRHARGATYPNSKLTDDIVREIRRLHTEERMEFKEMGKRFGVAADTCRKVARFRSWIHVK